MVGSITNEIHLPYIPCIIDFWFSIILWLTFFVTFDVVFAYTAEPASVHIHAANESSELRDLSLAVNKSI